MKNIFIKVFINLIIIIVIFLIADYLYFCQYHYFNCKKENGNDCRFFNNSYNTYEKLDKTSFYYNNVHEYFLEKKVYNPSIIPDKYSKEKKPVILFGCSFVYDLANEHLQYLLAKYTGRKIYNFSFDGWGTQHMYYLINKPMLYDIIGKPDPEFAIYTYIRDHKYRIFDVRDEYYELLPYLAYDNKNGKLVKRKYNIITKNLFRSAIFRHLVWNYNYRNFSNKKSYEMLYKYVSESYYELKKHYPDIKFIIFEYYQDKENIPEEEEMFKKLQDIGIIYISTKDLTSEDLSSEKYVRDMFGHPNLDAWNILIKPLSNKLENIK